MPQSAHSSDPSDPHVHHPEEECQQRMELIEAGKALWLEVPEANPTGTLDDPSQMRFIKDKAGKDQMLTRCTECRRLSDAKKRGSGG
jgi:hypothetical protein